ncbi:MAG: hypothetical protein J6N21_09185 [Butyrivibrio sp.]|nr:hypothetical protein [Butyrivibrio sp.]
MIQTLYEPFKHWSDGGSIFILSDLHFDDADCKAMNKGWITPEEQLQRINKLVNKNDTFVCLGDVGKAAYVKQIKAKRKVLLLGNHDRRSDYVGLFDEIYTGPLFIADKILLSHEPVHGLPWCLNIHGHDHNGVEPYDDGCKYLNLAANVCDFTPINLGKLIKSGILSDIRDIHRVTIDGATARKNEQKQAEEVLLADIVSSENREEISEKAREELENYFVDKYVLSPEVKAKIVQDNIVFSDADKATIIFNCCDDWFEKRQDLKLIADFTEDNRLKEQIAERIDYDMKSIQKFADNRGGLFYSLKIKNMDDDEEDYGYYKELAYAISIGRETSCEFRIEKYQLLIKGKEAIKSYAYMRHEMAGDIYASEYYHPEFPVAEFSFDSKGRVKDYYSYELPLEDQEKVDEMRRDRFESSYVVVPNPYERGDRVRVIGTELVGTVDVSQKDWKKYVEKALLPDSKEDWVDASITVRCSEDGLDHYHVNPIYLEKVSE